MNKTRFLLSAVALTFSAGAAVAQTPATQSSVMTPAAVVAPNAIVVDQRAPLTRADVKAEAASAARTGDKPMGEISQKGQDKGKTKP